MPRPSTRRRTVSPAWHSHLPSAASGVRARPVLLTLLAVLAATGLPCLAHAQVIRVDQRSRKVWLVNRDSTELTNGDDVELARSRTATIELSNTNSALYRCTVADTETSVPALDSLKSFLKVLGPYATDLSSAFGTRGAAQGRLLETARPADSASIALRDLLEELHGDAGVYQARALALSVLDSVRTSAFDTLRLRNALDGGRFCNDQDCTRLKPVVAVTRSLGRLDRAVQHLQELVNKLENDPAVSRDTVARYNALLVEVRKPLDDESTILDFAYDTERLYLAAWRATPTVACKSLSIAWNTGRDFTIDVVPASSPLLARIATDEPFTFKARLLPHWALRPTLGISLLYADDAVYRKFGSAKFGASDSVAVISTGTDDQRLNYAVMLSLIAYENAHSGFSIAPVEILANPIDQLKSIGVGAGIGYRLLRLGVGYVWFKHSELDAQTIGQHLSTADELATTDTYHSGKMYVSVSVTGVPPFVRN